MDLAGGFRGAEFAPDVMRAVRYEQLPAWVTSTAMLDKTGVAYITVDTRGAGTGGLNLWFHGVPWRRWSVDVLRIDATGRMAGRGTLVPVVHGEWSTAVELLDDVAQLVVVVNDQGNRDYDPDALPDANGFFALNIAR
jgi:hypothetical protein